MELPEETTADLRRRLRRIEGQVRGIQQMAGLRYCVSDPERANTRGSSKGGVSVRLVGSRREGGGAQTGLAHRLTRGRTRRGRSCGEARAGTLDAFGSRVGIGGAGVASRARFGGSARGHA
ncbi:MAG: metal-sensing transcriptional repressor [Actinobacteria bacterium]|nr:metal-sensing transcriptional repressor [Actinomycetota bacterium]MSY71452.1 metal-sensing transcriptional repressor [Actinomycetota bacterium]